MTIANILNKISSENNIGFSYGKLNDVQKTKTLYFKNAKLKFVLNRLFENTNIRYMAFPDHIILVENQKISEKKYILGYIVDNETDQPIPYATIMLLKSGKGIISDHLGKFEIEITRDEKDTLKFNSLPYHSFALTTDQLWDKTSVKIRLKPKTYPIDEVRINAEDYTTSELGNKGLFSTGNIYLDTHGQEIALFIENRKNKPGIIQNISFKFSKKGNSEAPFRIRIYECNPAGKPGKDILKDLIVVKPDTMKSWYLVDISDYHIKLPETGLFVSVGGVFPDDYFFYSGSNGFRDISADAPSNNPDALSYGQRICYNNWGMNRTWHYALSKQWFQLDKKRFNVMMKVEIVYKKTKQ